MMLGALRDQIAEIPQKRAAIRTDFVAISGTGGGDRPSAFVRGKSIFDDFHPNRPTCRCYI